MDSIVVSGEEIDVIGTKLDLKSACTKIGQKDEDAIKNYLKQREYIDTIDLSSNSFAYHRWSAIAEIISSRSNLTSLNLSANYLETAAHWNSISNALSTLHFLTELDISSNLIDSQGMTALVGALQNNNSLKKLLMSAFNLNNAMDTFAQLLRYSRNITYLDLFGGMPNGTLSSLPIIIALVNNRTITYLDLGRSIVPSQTKDNRTDYYELLGSISSLQTLKLKSHAMTDQEVEVLIYSLLRSHADITTLDLSENLIEMKKTRALTILIEECNTLTDLDISENKIDQQRMAILESSISRSSTLKSLNVQGRGRGKASSYSDSFTLFKDNTSITNLNLSGYGFDHIAESKSIKLIGLKNIKVLNLMSCLLKEKAEIIVSELINTPIEELNLADNYMNYEGVKALPNLIRHTKTLKKLDISRNMLNHEFPKILEPLSVNNTITELDVSNNFLVIDGSKALQKVFAVNTTMKTLKANAARFDIQCIKELIMTNRSLTKLHIKNDDVHQHSDYNIILLALRSNISLTEVKWMYSDLNIDRGFSTKRVFPSMMVEGEKIIFENKRRKLYASAALTIAQTILLSYDQGLFASVPLEVLEQILCHCSGQYFTKKQIGLICSYATQRPLSVDWHTLCSALIN